LTEVENKFLDFLNYRISQKDSFFKKIPEFEEKIQEMDFKIGLKESMLRVKQNFEVQRRKATYKTIVDELNDLIKKSKDKKKK
jgi:hypothetical protein